MNQIIVNYVLLFFGVLEIPLGGKTDETAIFNNLLHFRVESGDVIVGDHFKMFLKMRVTCHRIQNKLICIIGSVISNIKTYEGSWMFFNTRRWNNGHSGN